MNMDKSKSFKECRKIAIDFQQATGVSIGELLDLFLTTDSAKAKAVLDKMKVEQQHG